jgi:hypothetical protein
MSTQPSQINCIKILQWIINELFFTRCDGIDIVKKKIELDKMD